MVIFFLYIDMEKLESENPPVFRRYVNDSVVHDELDSNTLEEFLYVIAYWQALFWLPYKSSGSVMCTFICKEKCLAQILYACASKERFEEISTILY